MNQEDIIRMAQEVGGIDKPEPGSPGVRFLERFATLVAAHVREQEFKPDWLNFRQGFETGAAEEREACAALVQANADACEAGSLLQQCLASNAAAILARCTET